MIHQLKQMEGAWVIVKCGERLPKKGGEWTGWHDQITCEKCRPDLREPVRYDRLSTPGKQTRKDPKKEQQDMSTPKTITFPKDTMTEVKTLRDTEGMKWAEIAESMDISSGKAILIYNFATVAPKDKVKDATPAQIRKLREGDNLSWGIISSRTGYSESSCRSMYEEAASRSARGTRIGKGGRYPEGDAPAKSTKAPAKKTPAKKAAAKKAPATTSPLKGLKSQEIKDAITGYAVKYNGDTIAVKAVKKASATAIVLTDSDGKARTLKTAGVEAVSKKKVV